MAEARLVRNAPQPPGWTTDVFVNCEDAEVALGEDRANFLQRWDIMSLIPIHVRRRIAHLGGIAQIEGFYQLFVLLNADPDTVQLRQLIVDYFKQSHYLRGYIS